MIAHLIFFLIRRVMGLRYRVKVRGLDKVRAALKPGGTLFLSNHPALVDPVLNLMTFWPEFQMRPLIIDYMYEPKGVRWFYAGHLRAVSVPDFNHGANSYKRMLGDQSLQTIVEGLKGGDNFLVYPAGRLQRAPEEMIGGASAAYEIVRSDPEANVVLVRARGLWGSLFGWGVSGEQPRVGRGMKEGLKILLKNLIFFTPRRTVTFDLEVVQPPRGDRLLFNRWLERWFNQPGPHGEAEPLSLVSYSRWKQELPEVTYRRPYQDGDVDRVPEGVQEEVLRVVSRLSKRSPEEIEPGMHLFTDLGLDSLDIADLVLSLMGPKPLPPEARPDMMTVGAVMALAAGEFTVAEPEPIVPVEGWEEASRPMPDLPAGETVQEAFLRVADRMGRAVACADEASGALSYAKVKRAALVLAERLRNEPGENIGILLPASCGAMICVLATLLAGKVPVMINWTVGARYLETVKEVAGVERVLTSASFLGRLEGADLTPIHKQIVTLESIRKSLSWKEKWRGARLARKRAETILRLLGPFGDRAVILFTSGTEAAPKAVPLTHFNILSNQQAAGPLVDFRDTDVLYSILPPFHSLGFTVTGLFPLVSGGKVFYSPNPTDAAKLGREIEAYGATIFCAAPTFLKGLKAASRPEQLRSLRLVVTGAEKAPEELFEWIPGLIEGYGITECSPILTMNRVGDVRRGVGQPIDHIQLRVLHPETHEPLKQGETGLVVAQGPNVFGGYLSGESDPFVELEGGRWYVTGDLGYLDEVGALHLSGRLKRFVKMGGEMVSLPALEDVLTSQGWGRPGKAEYLAVIAKEEEGERPELHLMATFDVELDLVNEALRKAGMGSLAKISEVHRLEHMPLMGSGKSDLRRLQEMLGSS